VNQNQDFSVCNASPIVLKRFIQLNIDDYDVFTIVDSECNRIFTGNASGFLDACLENSKYCKYLKWYVVYFSSDLLKISDCPKGCELK